MDWHQSHNHCRLTLWIVVFIIIIIDGVVPLSHWPPVSSKFSTPGVGAIAEWWTWIDTIVKVKIIVIVVVVVNMYGCPWHHGSLWLTSKDRCLHHYHHICIIIIIHISLSSYIIIIIYLYHNDIYHNFSFSSWRVIVVNMDWCLWMLL